MIRNPSLVFYFNYFYPEKESNGYQLSLKRAESMVNFLLEHGARNKVIITIQEGEKAVLELRENW